MIRLLTCVFIFNAFAATSLHAAPPIRVMSFNIRLGVANDGANHWDKRKPLVATAIKRFAPDLLGTQETFKFQADYLQEQLNTNEELQYAYFGRSRMKSANEHCGIFYNESRFTWLAGGHFWLSEHPEIPESKSWDSSLPRMATWILLSDKQAENEPAVLFVNTHFDHRGTIARHEAAKVIRQRIDQIKNIANQPHVIVTGDFNCPEGSQPYKAFVAGKDDLLDTYRSAHPEKQAKEGTFNSWRGMTSGPRIDWIFASPSLTTKQASIVTWSDNGRYPSDHFPITAVLESVDSAN